MKQRNHSPEAAAAMLGLSLQKAYERMAIIRRRDPRYPIDFRLVLPPKR